MDIEQLSLDEIEEMNEHAYDATTDREGPYDFSGLREFLFTVRAQVEDAQILDIGCGTGSISHHLSSESYVGIDISGKTIEMAQDLHPDHDFRKMSFRKMDFPDNTFAGVIAIASIQHEARRNTVNVLREVLRVMTPRGLLFMVLHEGDEELLIPDKQDKGVTAFLSLWNEADIKEALSQAGFVDIDLESTWHDLRCVACKPE